MWLSETSDCKASRLLSSFYIFFLEVQPLFPSLCLLRLPFFSSLLLPAYTPLPFSTFSTLVHPLCLPETSLPPSRFLTLASIPQSLYLLLQRPRCSPQSAVELCVMSFSTPNKDYHVSNYCGLMVGLVKTHVLRLVVYVFDSISHLFLVFHCSSVSLINSVQFYPFGFSHSAMFRSLLCFFSHWFEFLWKNLKIFP